ncbi:hypothetical protein J4232_03470 [Candidatus Woesearchaeota archaeon]|nr:hypothetical protein [Candidatus Woesearchaeota archaeon]
MVDSQLLDYINKEISKGFSLDQIKQMLLQYNYPEQTIMEAFALIQQSSQQTQQSSVPIQQSEQQTVQSDVQSGQQTVQSEQQLQQTQQQTSQEQTSQTAAQTTTTPAGQQAAQTNLLSKMQKASLHYVYLLSGLILVIVIIQFITSSFSVPNLIKSLVFLFIAVMTIVYAKQRFVKPRLILFYRIFLVLDIIVLIGLIIAMFK